MPIKAAQERLGHSRPDILLKFYAHVLDESADMAAETLSGQLSGRMFGRRSRPGRGLRTFEAPIGNHIGNQRMQPLVSIVVSC